jgi:hypothetical protein
MDQLLADRNTFFPKTELKEPFSPEKKDELGTPISKAPLKDKDKSKLI